MGGHLMRLPQGGLSIGEGGLKFMMPPLGKSTRKWVGEGSPPLEWGICLDACSQWQGPFISSVWT